jgi:small subunit ribosomal protein S20
MPQRLAAKRYLRKSLKNREHNLNVTNALKNTIKKFKKAITTKNSAESTTTLSEAYKKLDKAAKTHLIHPNKAARLKSRLTQVLNKSKVSK